MRRVALRRRDGSVAAYTVVDDADHAKVAEHTWRLLVTQSGKRYATAWIDGRTVYMHRLLLGEPKGDVDHRDGNGLNNQRGNLRPATRGQNKRNRRRARADSKSGALGVHWKASKRRWVAETRIDGERWSCMRRTKREAIEAITEHRREHDPFSHVYVDVGRVPSTLQ